MPLLSLGLAHASKLTLSFYLPVYLSTCLPIFLSVISLSLLRFHSLFL